MFAKQHFLLNRNNSALGRECNNSTLVSMMQVLDRRLLGAPDSLPMEHRMVNAVNLVCSLTMLFATIVNWRLGLSGILILLTLADGFLFGIGYWICRHKQWYSIGFPFTVFNLLFAMSVLWFANGGSLGGAQYYFPLAGLALGVLSSRKWLGLITFTMIVVVTLLIAAEYQWPHTVFTYKSSTDRVFDVWISLLSSILIAGFSGTLMHSTYTKYKTMVDKEKRRSEDLLAKVFPAPIVQRLRMGQSMVADRHDSLTILFADLCEFSRLSQYADATEVLWTLNLVYGHFDMLVSKHGAEKVKTIGDAYMAVAGIPGTNPDHANCLADLAKEMRDTIGNFHMGSEALRIRIALHSGPASSGVIGHLRPQFDLWGDTVNTASRLEGQAQPGQIIASHSTMGLLHGRVPFRSLGVQDLRGLGRVQAAEIHPVESTAMQSSIAPSAQVY